ncbi:MAG: hypothetical protein HY673_12995 [Chloroflexi bacterium]|nr:hypothetical protein [Chloroflexota bacterium]
MGVPSLSLAVPANTLEQSPASQSITLGEGYFRGLLVQFPRGCEFLVKLACYLSTTFSSKERVLPSESFQETVNYIALDDWVGELPVDLDITKASTFWAEAWNDDVQNTHTIKVIPVILPLADSPRRRGS